MIYTARVKTSSYSKRCKDSELCGCKYTQLLLSSPDSVLYSAHQKVTQDHVTFRGSETSE